MHRIFSLLIFILLFSPTWAQSPQRKPERINTQSDYFDPIIELAEQRGFKVVNEPYEFTIGPRQLVRGDFNKPRGKLNMWQSSLVIIDKGFIVSFTFVAGSEDELDELIERLR